MEHWEEDRGFGTLSIGPYVTLALSPAIHEGGVITVMHWFGMVIYDSILLTKTTWFRQ